MSTPVTLDDIRNARDRIRTLIRETPMLTCPDLGDFLGLSLFIKCENLQDTGSFKARGACNALFSSTDDSAAAAAFQREGAASVADNTGPVIDEKSNKQHLSFQGPTSTAGLSLHLHPLQLEMAHGPPTKSTRPGVEHRHARIARSIRAMSLLASSRLHHRFLSQASASFT